MKASKAYEKDKFNVMSWEWLDADTVVIGLIDNNTGKAGKLKVKIVNEQIDEILEDEEMK